MTEKLSFFDIMGTIMHLAINRLETSLIINMWIEDGNGRYNIVMSDTVKGFDRNLLKFGHSVRVKGIVHRCYFINDFGEEKISEHYNALELIF